MRRDTTFPRRGICIWAGTHPALHAFECTSSAGDGLAGAGVARADIRRWSRALPCWRWRRSRCSGSFGCREPPRIRRWRGRRPRWSRSILSSSRKVPWPRLTCRPPDSRFGRCSRISKIVRGSRCSGSRWRRWRKRPQSWLRLALFAWQLIVICSCPRGPNFVTVWAGAHARSHLLLPVVPLACWYAYHCAKTGFLFGNPEFFRYNLAATLRSSAYPAGSVYEVLASCWIFWTLPADTGGIAGDASSASRSKAEVARPRIAIWQQAAFAAVLLAYLVFMSAVGGAVLARYLLPVVPLVMLAWVSTLWRRARYWKLIVAAMAIAFVAGLFVNPPYGFSLEDNLAYRDYVVMHAEASRFLAMRYPECACPHRVASIR